MMPAGPLMKEHRVIERMVRIMNKRIESIKKENKVDPLVIDIVIDFIRTYADRCHHGKEEEILFKDLAKKKLSGEHARIMNELLEEHKMGRGYLRDLGKAKESYVKGNKGALKDIMSDLQILVEFYPKHIEKEDKHFFIPCMDYFTQQERDKMLEEMREFNGNMIHEKYKEAVKNLE